MLHRVVGKAGDGTFVEPLFLPDYGCNVIIGQNFLFFQLEVCLPSLPLRTPMYITYIYILHNAY